MEHNKLVRDKIPSIIEGKGVGAQYHIATGYELEKALHAKLLEEVNEFLNDETIEELADVYEVIEAIIKLHDFDKEEVEAVKKVKKEAKGGFEKGVILDTTER